MKLKYFLQLLGPAIFLYILSRIDFAVLGQELKNLSWSLLFFSFLLMMLQLVFKSLRWQAVLAALKIDLSSRQSIGLYWLGAFVGVITPGRLGEAVKVYFLKNRGYGAFRSFFSVILDRLIDILALLFFGLLIFWFFLPEIGIYVIVAGALVLVALIAIFLLFDERSFLNKIFGRMIGKILPVDFSDYSRFNFVRLWAGIKKVKGKNFFLFAVYFFIAWFLYFFSKYQLALAMGLDLSFGDVSVAAVAIALVNILPVSVAGIGTREAAAIYLLGLYGIAAETALLFSLLIFATDMITVSFGLIPYFRESALLSKARLN